MLIKEAGTHPKSMGEKVKSLASYMLSNFWHSPKSGIGPENEFPSRCLHKTEF
jgi:hypothetical protein